MNPSDGEGYFMLHRNYLALGDTTRAIAVLDSASKHHRYNENYHQKFVDLTLAYGETDLTKIGHDRLVRYFSHKSAYRINRGKFYLKQENFDLAQEDFEQVIKYDKTNGEAYYYLAIIKGM